MKTALGVAITVLALIVPWDSIMAEAQPNQSINLRIQNLNSPKGIIGQLAVPLGTVVEIEAEIADNKQPRLKSLEDALLLKVKTVQGKKLSEECMIEARWFPVVTSSKLAGKVRLIGYETGEFTGVPGEAFSYMLPVSSESFHFANYFLIIKVVDAK